MRTLLSLLQSLPKNLDTFKTNNRCMFLCIGHGIRRARNRSRSRYSVNSQKSLHDLRALGSSRETTESSGTCLEEGEEGEEEKEQKESR